MTPPSKASLVKGTKVVTFSWDSEHLIIIGIFDNRHSDRSDQFSYNQLTLEKARLFWKELVAKGFIRDDRIIGGYPP